MDIFKARKISLSSFLKSPSGKGYFVPQSPIKRDRSYNKNIKDKKQLIVESEFYNKNYFRYTKRESPSNCRIKKLELLAREKFENIIRRLESRVSDFKLGKAEKNTKSTQVVYVEIKNKLNNISF